MIMIIKAKHDSKTFFINDIFGYDEYFSSYSQKKIKYINFVWKKCDYTIKSYIILTVNKYVTRTVVNGLEVKTV